MTSENKPAENELEANLSNVTKGNEVLSQLPLITLHLAKSESYCQLHWQSLTDRWRRGIFSDVDGFDPDQACPRVVDTCRSARSLGARSRRCVSTENELFVSGNT